MSSAVAPVSIALMSTSRLPPTLTVRRLCCSLAPRWLHPMPLRPIPLRSSPSSSAPVSQVGVAMLGMLPLWPWLVVPPVAPLAIRLLKFIL